MPTNLIIWPPKMWRLRSKPRPLPGKFGNSALCSRERFKGYKQLYEAVASSSKMDDLTAMALSAMPSLKQMLQE
ncbi:hypothetical protein RRG08_063199 [Elysia crispata]|uniref:Uncharacterized protein n=1 Tax=Elysia crispata TaxID=231223 RepID=A0AAE1D4J2_9GAST|nr:hypothetical protein RRG08_063199 [Elysia crispata]